jgi:hypothetical protein
MTCAMRTPKRPPSPALLTLLLLGGAGAAPSLSCSDSGSTTPHIDARADSVRADVLVSEAAHGDRTLSGEASHPDSAAADAAGSACSSTLDLTPLSLDSSYCVVARYAPTLSAAIDAFAYTGTSVSLYSLVSGTTTSGSVLEAAADPKTSTLGTTSSVFTFTPSATGNLYAGEYLALSSSGEAAVGYTDSSSGGAVEIGTKGGSPTSVTAKGNYDALYLDNKVLLVNGQGAGTASDGQGVYVVESGKTPRRLIKDLGNYSGHLALGKDALFAGGYFSTGNKVYGFTISEVKSAIAAGSTLSATSDGDLCFSGSALDMTAEGEHLVVLEADSSYAWKSISTTTATVSGTSVLAASNKKDIVTPGTTSATVSRLASSGKEIALLLKTTKTEIAVILKR